MLPNLKSDFLSESQPSINEKGFIKILVIEENKADLQIFEKNLKKSVDAEYFDIVSAPNISEGLSLLMSGSFDIILPSFSSINISSLRTIEILNKKFPTVPIVVFSATKNDEMAVAAVQKGAQEFIVRNTLSGDALALALRFSVQRQKCLLEGRNDRLRYEYSADFDPLTDLPNKHIFNDRLQQALVRAQRNSMALAVFFLDIDGFNEIVEAFGRRIADLLLISISTKFKKAVRDSDTISRVGSDQFLFLLDELSSPEDAGIVIKKLISTFKDPIIIDSEKYYISASIGISLYPTDAKIASDLIELANAATYQAREFGRNQYRFHSTKLNIQEIELSEQGRALSKAFEKNQLEIHYQPQVNLKTGVVSGMHALLKWNHPEHGYINLPDCVHSDSPDFFSNLNRWFLDQACRQLKQWHEDGNSHLHLIINLSRPQLHDPQMIEATLETAERYRLVTGHLNFEISESDILENWERSLEFLSNLHTKGINLTLSRFGAEFSSIGNLRAFPLQSVKIDSSILSKAKENNSSGNLTKALLDIVHGFDLHSIAEGVETEDQVHFLRRMGCQFAQGILFGLPMLPDLVVFK